MSGEEAVSCRRGSWGGVHREGRSEGVDGGNSELYS